MFAYSTTPDGVRITPFQVRVLFAQSGRIGIYSFKNSNESFLAFHTILSSWDIYGKVAVQTVNGISVIDTTELAAVTYFN